MARAAYVGVMKYPSNCIVVLLCTILIVLSIWVTRADASSFIQLQSCKLTSDSTTEDMQIKGPSDVLGALTVRKDSIVAIYQVDHKNKDGVACSIIMLTNGRTKLVVGTRNQLLRRLFYAGID